MFKSLEIDEFGPWFARHFEGYEGISEWRGVE